MSLENITSTHDTTVAYFICFVNIFHLVCHFISLGSIKKSKDKWHKQSDWPKFICSPCGLDPFFREGRRCFYWKMKSLLLILKSNTFWFWQKETHFRARNFLTADHYSVTNTVFPLRNSQKEQCSSLQDQGVPRVHCSNTSTISDSSPCVCQTHTEGGFGC